ncbi:MAG: twin-arginine translocase TatA/TatE family subunit [Acidobacteria bacterium]|nr:twin-arginine translocase TatA/TatE family subunit [Acidobacteriota bacterium]
MGNLGMPEMIFILVLALLLFGPKKLPEIGKQVGKALGEFKRASNDLKRTIEDEMEKATLRGGAEDRGSAGPKTEGGRPRRSPPGRRDDLPARPRRRRRCRAVPTPLDATPRRSTTTTCPGCPSSSTSRSFAPGFSPPPSP